MLKNIGNAVARHPWFAIGIVLIITLISAGNVAYFGLDQTFSEDTFLPDLTEVTASNDITENFSSTYDVSLLVKGNNNDVLTKECLIEILNLEWDIVNSSIREKLYTPNATTNSIISVADIITQMLLQKQVATFEEKHGILQPLNDTQLKTSIKSMLSSSNTPTYVKSTIQMMLTSDFNITSLKAKGTIIYISLNETVGNNTAIALATERTIDQIVSTHNFQSIKVYTMGNQIITDEIMNANNDSMAIILPAAFALIIIILILIYRDLLDTLVSLMALAFAILWMYGYGAAMQYSFNPMTTAIPVLLVGLGIDYGIHLTMRYRQERSKNDKAFAVEKTIQFVGMALLLATITTVIAFLSNLVSPIKLLGEFGILSAVGIIASFFIMILLIPAYNLLRDQRSAAKKQVRKEANNIFGDIMAHLSKPLVHHAKTVISITLIITFLMGYSASQLSTRFEYEDFLPQKLEITKNLRYLLDEFTVAGGQGEEVYILIYADITQADVLRNISATIDNMKNDDYILKNGDKPDVISVLSVMQDYATFGWLDDTRYDKEFAALYNEYFEDGQPKANTSSVNITYLYNYLVTKYQGDIGMVLTKNSGYDKGLLRIRVSAQSENEVAKLKADMETNTQPLSEYETVITGGPILNQLIMQIMEKSQTESLAITLFASLIVLTIIFYIRDKSLVLGALTLIPVALCVIWILGTMFLLGIPLNVMTITIASLTVGLGVTYGIHITHRFMEELQENEAEEACVATIKHTGASLFGAAATTIAGFGLLVFALMPPLQQFGSITALTILYSFIASTFILPSVLLLWVRWKNNRTT